jgi:hypothetical protein
VEEEVAHVPSIKTNGNGFCRQDAKDKAKPERGEAPPGEADYSFSRLALRLNS